MVKQLRQPPPKPAEPAWWTQPLTREQFDAKAAERAREVEAAVGTQGIQRREGDR